MSIFKKNKFNGNIFKQNRFNDDCRRMMFYCLTALVFMLPFSYEVSSALLVLGWLIFIYKSVKGFFEWNRTVFDFPIIIFTAAAFASVFVSPDPGFSFYNCYNLVGRYVLTYYLAVQCLAGKGLGSRLAEMPLKKFPADMQRADAAEAAKKLRILLGAAALSLVIVLVYGFLQAFAGIGLGEEMPWTDEAIFPGLKTRVFSTWENPNLLGGYLDFVMGMAAGVFFAVKNRRLRTAIVVLWCIAAFCLTLTYARGACISIGLVIAVYGAIYNRRVLLGIIILAAVMLLSDATLLERLTSVFTKLDTSSEMRLAFWESTIAMILDHPVLGIGWGAYFMVYPHYDYYMQGNFIKIVHAHNMYLNFLAEVGMVGFISFMAYFFGSIVRAFKMQARCSKMTWQRGLLLGTALGMAALALNGLTDYVMFNTELSMTVWLFAGVAAALPLFDNALAEQKAADKNTEH